MDHPALHHGVMNCGLTEKEPQQIMEEIERVRQEIENATLSWADKDELKAELMLLSAHYTAHYPDLADPR